MSQTDTPQAPFPTTLADVTASWLATTLQTAGALTASDRVVDFEAIPLGEGYGMSGNLARLVLRYADGRGPVASVIFKCATSSEANRAVAATFDMFNREFSFYKTLAPRVSELIPTCYFAAYDPETLDCSLVLEDLTDYRRGDQAVGCDVDDARVCLDRMAALHATWFDKTDDPALAWVPRVNGDMYKVGMVAGVKVGWEPCMEIFGSVVPDEVKSAKERYLAGLPGLHDRMGSGHQTLLHGDFRLDNLLFGQEGGHRDVVLIDWQGIIVSKPTQDLAYFLTQNVTTDVRRKHEDELLERYHSGAHRARRDRLQPGRVLGRLQAVRPVPLGVRRRDRRHARPGQRSGRGLHEQPVGAGHGRHH